MMTMGGLTKFQNGRKGLPKPKVSAQKQGSLKSQRVATGKSRKPTKFPKDMGNMIPAKVSQATPRKTG
jgi:hypothetical protein